MKFGSHRVNIEVKKGKRKKKFDYDQPSLIVARGDTITWKLKNNFPYLIVFKEKVSPLNWSFKTAGRGKKIVGRVAPDAAAGTYRYGVGTYDGTGVLFDDPEIIIKRPGM